MITVGLDFVVKVDAPYLSYYAMQNGNIDFWGYGTWQMHWVVDAQYMIPMNKSTYFAPLFGHYYLTDGKKGMEPPEEYKRLRRWYLDLTRTPQMDRKLELGQKILKQWAEECYVIGICRKEMLTLVSNHLRNVPENIIHSWTIMSPGVIN